MGEVYNFSAGPSILPKKVLKRAAEEMLDYNNTGQSVMEMSHRSKEFESILEETQSVFREVADIPSGYKVLFLQGGGSMQFAAVPLNLAVKTNKADYVVTGQWAKKAAREAAKYADINIVASSADKNFTYIPKLDREKFNSESDYFYICLNNTVYGTKFYEIPDTGNVPLVADVSSCILSEPIDVSKFGVLFAGVQKNMGPAGVTVVIIREDLLTEPMHMTPSVFNYKLQAENRSLYNTPPTYSIYMCKLVLKWIKEDIGGLAKMKEINDYKAKIVYDFLDSSNLFKGTAEKKSRSIMNITFTAESEDLNKKFIKEAEEKGFINLKGHRTVGGMRASLYNAMPVETVKKLVCFMQDFESKNK